MTAAADGRRRRWWRPGLLVLVVIGVLLAFAPRLALLTGGVLPGSLASAGSLTVLATIFVYCGFAISFDIVYGYAGILSFGHALSFALGGYATAWLLNHTGLSLWQAAIAGVGVAAVVALPLGLLALRARGIALAMVTLAFAQSVSIVIERNMFGLSNGEDGLAVPTDRMPEFLLGIVNVKHVYWICLAGLALVVVLAMWSSSTESGHLWRAVRENELRVSVLGARPYLVRLTSWMIGSVLAAICGVGYLIVVGRVSPTIADTMLSLTVLLMVVLGGAGRLWGAAVGAVVYTWLDQRLPVWANTTTVQDLPTPVRAVVGQPLALFGIVVVLFVLFSPGGIAGLRDRVAARRRWRHRLGGVVRPAPTGAAGDLDSTRPEDEVLVEHDAQDPQQVS